MAKKEPNPYDVYRKTHGADGYPLGGSEYPDNRAGRRAMARTWKGKKK